MDKVKEISIEDYNYPLPDDRIARHPAPGARDTCRLLVSDAQGGITHHRFTDVADLLQAGTLLVRNNTRVINARLKFRKETGATIEIFLLEPEEPSDYAQMFQATGSCRWHALVGNLKRWKEGVLTKVTEAAGTQVTLTARRLPSQAEGESIVELSWTPASLPFSAVVESAGYIPIPPYLNRSSEAVDATDYQTVYSRIQGSVAAPTAGLHFTDETFRRLRDNGVETRDLTLHVGAGTFRPVKSDRIGEHEMHTETFVIDRSLVEALMENLREGRPIAAVGTTTVRTLESLPLLGIKLRNAHKENNTADDGGALPHLGQWDAYEMEQADTEEGLHGLLEQMDRLHTDSLTASTAIIIAPGFKWRVTDAMVTNFHQPKSTLLLLVASFLGDDTQWRKIYAEALAEGYRFLSYGDGSLLFRLRNRH